MALCQDLLRSTLWRGVAVREADGAVVEGQARQADPAGLRGAHVVYNGHEVLGDLVAEGLDLLDAVAVAAETVVTQGQVGFVAHVAGLLGAVAHQGVVEGVQLLAVGVEPAALGLVGAAARGAVPALLVGPELGQGELCALPIRKGRGVELLVFAVQAVFLLHEGEVLGRKAADLDLQVHKEHLAQAGLQLLPERGAQQRQVHGLRHLLDDGLVLVRKGVFRVIERVAGVDAVADVGQGRRGRVLLGERVGLAVGALGLVRALRALDPRAQGLELLPQRGDVRPLIRHFGELHGTPLSAARVWGGSFHDTPSAQKTKGRLHRARSLRFILRALIQMLAKIER